MSGRSRLLTGGVPYTPMPTLLTTERFILTPEELSDAPWLAELFTARGGAAVSEAQARERVAAMHQLTRTHGIGAYVLWPRDGGTPVGYAAIIVGRGTVEEPELAYELLPDAHGHGYATEAARAVLAAAFATSRRRVWATVRPGTRRPCGSWTSSAVSIRSARRPTMRGSSSGSRAKGPAL